jgi:opacity protein-like surface antigen
LNTSITNSIGYSAGLGYAYFINSKVSLDASLEYYRVVSQVNIESDSDSGTLPKGSGFSQKSNGIDFSLGVRVFW